MIKNIIKRDGRIEPYLPSKLNSWGKWAAAKVGKKVDWSSIVIQTVSTLPDTVTSSELQEKLIQICLDRESYSYYLMAGRLYAAHLHKTIHNGKIPSIKELHGKMVEDGIMVPMNYSDQEYAELDNVIDHELDFDTPHFALHHIRNKYSLQNRTNAKEYETQQFVYMRMAMALSEGDDRALRLELVKSFYKQFNSKRLLAPTPNYVNLGTVLKGYASCCLIAVGDQLASLAAGDHIAYMMTASSAGIGTNIMSRSKGDPVRNGLISHQGKLPYIASLGKAVRANTQCYSDTTDILTNKGFIKFSELTESHLVAQVREDRGIEFVKPTEIISYHHKGQMISFATPSGRMGISQEVTPNHRMAWRKSSKATNERLNYYLNKNWTQLNKNYVASPIYEITLAEDFIPSRETVLDFGGFATGTEELTDMDRFRIAFQADGVTKPVGDYAYTFRFTRERKIHRFETLLNSIGFEYSKSLQVSGITSFYVKVGELLTKDFSCFDLTNKSLKWMRGFLYELPHWDGSFSVDSESGSFIYSSGNLECVQFVQAVAACASIYSSISIETNEDRENVNPLYTVLISPSYSGTTGRNIEKKHYDYDAMVYCVTVPTGLLVIRHNGKTCVSGNSGRGGAVTLFYSGFDPEAEIVAHLRNPRSTEDRKNRDLHYALMTNKFFASKVAKNEQAFSFNPYTAPKLNEAFYSGDIGKFADIYKEYEESASFKKEYFNPRDLILTSLNEALETGVAYLANIDEMNRHTPFKEPIRSSNLCVAEDTILTTKEGAVVIKEKAGQYVEVWNGEQWSKSLVEKTGENQNLLIVETSNGQKLECTLYHKWYVINTSEKGNKYIKEVRTYELFEGIELAPYKLPDGTVISSTVTSISRGRSGADTYCVNEPIKHKAIFNGILTGQCLEIAETTTPYEAMIDLYSNQEVGYVKLLLSDGSREHFTYSEKVTKTDGVITYAGALKVGDVIFNDYKQESATIKDILEVKIEPEVALCSLAAVAIDNIDDTQGVEYFDEQYQEVMYHALKMVDYCILNSNYVLPHVGMTAKKRMNAAIGVTGLATYMAKRKLKYNSKEGLEEIHRVFERHMYHAIKASIRISKERGLAPWIHKTKWVDGWTPLDTYNRNVDELGDFELLYDWEALSEEIKANGGIAHSVLVAIMPNESSSKSVGGTNSVYPIRNSTLIKTDNNITVRWAAPHSDDQDYDYQIAWDVPEADMLKTYAVMQKWIDQSISADLWRRIKDDDKVSSRDLLNQYFTMVKYGVKTRYYYNSNTASSVSLTESGNINDNSNCVGGGCTL